MRRTNLQTSINEIMSNLTGVLIHLDLLKQDRTDIVYKQCLDELKTNIQSGKFEALVEDIFQYKKVAELVSTIKNILDVKNMAISDGEYEELFKSVGELQTMSHELFLLSVNYR